MSSASLSDVLNLTLEHLFLVGLSIGMAAALAIAAGILLTDAASSKDGCSDLRT